MSRSLVVLVALLLTLASPSSALELSGNNLLIPVAGRTPGAGGVFWETDLVITNLSPEYGQLTVTVETWINGERLSFNVDVPAMGTVTINDFMRTKFGREVATGIVRVSNALADAQLAARARVHTTTDVGQSVPALPMSSLAKESLVPGLNSSGSNRSNIGVANPNDVAADISLELINSDGHLVVAKPMQVAPHTSMQQEVAGLFHPQITDGDNTIRVVSSQPVYAFGSVVRTSSADPSFVLPTTTRKSPDNSVTPQCSDPAPLIFPPGIVRPGWIIAYKPGTDTKTVTPALSAKYGFTPTFTIGIFVAANLTPEMIAGLRCEPPVKSISQGSHVSLED